MYNNTGDGGVMGNLSVHIDRLNIGPYGLDSQKFSPDLKASAESCLSSFISKYSVTPNGKPLPFHLKMDPQGATLRLGEKQITLKKGAHLEPIRAIYRYHQNVGHLPRSGMNLKEEKIRDQATQKTVVAMNKSAIPGTNDHVLAGMRIAEESLSVTRNFLFALPSIGPDDPIVTHLGYYAGMFWTFFSVRELDGGITEYKRAKRIGDEEGRRRAAIRVASGSVCTPASFAYLAGKVCDTFVSAPVASALLNSAEALFGIGSMIAMGAALLGTYRCYSFNDRINDYLENKNLTQVERLRGVLHYLKDAISVTPEEKTKIEKEIERKHPQWTQEKKARFLQQKIADLTETKVKHMKRRTSNKSLQMILTQSSALLHKLNSSETQAEGIKEATLMIDKIQKENKAKLALYALSFVAALISFVALGVMTFFSAGALPFVLYGIAGTIYLAISVYNVSGMITRKDTDAFKSLELHPLQDMGSFAPPQHISL